MKIRNELLHEVHSYADHTPIVTGNTLDCSLGENPYGFPSVVREAYASFDTDSLSHYPHSDVLQKAIAEYWKHNALINPENIVLADGSISTLYLLCNILAKPGAKVVGFLPAFTNMVEYSRMMGMEYVGIPGQRNDRYAEDVDAMLAAINHDTALVYIDRPNNPTGQTLPIPEVCRVLDKCEQLGVYAIVDEAYGDFLPREESAVTIGSRYKNIIVVRTFSKGFGLAGLRSGYIITSKELISYIGKISNPYMLNEVGRILSVAALRDATFPVCHSEDFAAVKKAIREACGNTLIMAETDDRVPIFTLQHRNGEADLQMLLLREGILTCSGSEFEPLDRSAVRVRVPRREEAQRLIDAVTHVDRSV